MSISNFVPEKKLSPERKKKKDIFSLYVNYKDWLKEQQKN